MGRKRTPKWQPQEAATRNTKSGREAKSKEAERGRETLWPENTPPNTPSSLISLRSVTVCIPFPNWWTIQALFCIRPNQSERYRV